jgi:hypothetical protein
MKEISEKHFIWVEWWRKSITLLEGSQATPARPSVRNNVNLAVRVIKCSFKKKVSLSLSLSLFVDVYLHRLWPPNTGQTESIIFNF